MILKYVSWSQTYYHTTLLYESGLQKWLLGRYVALFNEVTEKIAF